MITFKWIEQYDRNTGKKLNPIQVVNKYICDYTGQEIDCTVPVYTVNHNSIDPCFGDGPEEGWLHDTEYSSFRWELFAQPQYHFIETLEEPILFEQMMKEALEEIDVYNLDFLLRWARGKMLKRVYDNNPEDLKNYIQDYG